MAKVTKVRAPSTAPYKNEPNPIAAVWDWLLRLPGGTTAIDVRVGDIVRAFRGVYPEDRVRHAVDRLEDRDFAAWGDARDTIRVWRNLARPQALKNPKNPKNPTAAVHRERAVRQERLFEATGDRYHEGARDAHRGVPAANPRRDGRIDIVAMVRKAPAGGYYAVVAVNGREYAEWRRHGFDRADAAERARVRAAEERDRYVGDWDVTVTDATGE